MDEQSWEAVHSELLDAVAHALGTRITTVASVAQFLQGDSPRVAQFGSLLDAEASRLEAILGALRMLTALGKPDVRSFTIEELFSGVRGLVSFHPLFREGIPEIRHEPDAGAASGDMNASRRMLIMNLFTLANAGHGVSSVDARRDGGEVVIAIAAASAECNASREVRLRALVS